MTVWLAAEPEPAGTFWRDLIGLGAPVATVIAAVVAGAFLLRTSRKTPYDRLEVLVKLRTEWPDGLDGRDSLDRSIGHALLQIRVLEGDVNQPGATDEDLASERRVAREFREVALIFGSAVAGVVTVLMTITIGWWATSTPFLNGVPDIWLNLGVSFVGLALGVLAYFIMAPLYGPPVRVVRPPRARTMADLERDIAAIAAVRDRESSDRSEGGERTA